MIEVHINGSTGTPYVVTFLRIGNSLKTTCSCIAGENRRHCKHRLSLFSGDLSSVSGVHPSDLIDQIFEMLKGTDVEAALQELFSAEAQMKAATDRSKRAKKFLDRVMHK